MEFKQLDIKPEGNWLQRTLANPHTKKTLKYTLIGALAGLAIFYFTEGKELSQITSGDVLKSMLIGGFYGFFITNSPCARGKC